MLRQFWEKQSYSSSYPSSIICLLVTSKTNNRKWWRHQTTINFIFSVKVPTYAANLTVFISWLTGVSQIAMTDLSVCSHTVPSDQLLWQELLSKLYKQPAITATTGGSRSCADSASADWWYRVKLTIQQLWSVWWDPAPVSQCRHIQLDRRLSERERRIDSRSRQDSVKTLPVQNVNNLYLLTQCLPTSHINSSSFLHKNVKFLQKMKSFSPRIQ